MEAWLPVWHVKGGFHVMQLGAVMEQNKALCLKGEDAYAILPGLCLTLEAAMEKKREIVRLKREQGHPSGAEQ